MKIVVVDDHAILADGLQALLQSMPGYDVVKKIASGAFALAYLKTNPADLLITDYAMPDMDGVALVKAVRQIKPDLKIVVLSMHDEPSMIKEIIAAGINGYVLKKYAQQDLINAIAMVWTGEHYFSDEVRATLLQTTSTLPSENHLTDRELQVLKLLSKELSSKQIADQLFISQRTVETHRKNLMRKTGANNAIGLITYGYTKKLL